MVCNRKEAPVAQLLIRDLDPETVNRLKERALRHRRSLQGEIRLILEKEAAAGARDAWELADRIRASFGGRRFADSATLIREDRDR
jgi:plasmid stability protein